MAGDEQEAAVLIVEWPCGCSRQIPVLPAGLLPAQRDGALADTVRQWAEVDHTGTCPLRGSQAG